MKASGTLQLNDRQEHMTLLANSPTMTELTDEELAQVTGADGMDDMMEHMMEHMHGCDDRDIRLRLTRVRIEWRLRFEWLHVNLRVH